MVGLILVIVFFAVPFIVFTWYFNVNLKREEKKLAEETKQFLNSVHNTTNYEPVERVNNFYKKAHRIPLTKMFFNGKNKSTAKRK
jgi:hypothetical protein